MVNGQPAAEAYAHNDDHVLDGVGHGHAEHAAAAGVGQGDGRGDQGRRDQVDAGGRLHDRAHGQNLHAEQPEAEEKGNHGGHKPPGMAVVEAAEVAQAVDVFDVVHAPGDVQAGENLVDDHAHQPGENHDARGVHEGHPADGGTAAAERGRDGREKDAHGQAASGHGVVVEVGDLFHGPPADVNDHEKVEDDDGIIYPVNGHVRHSWGSGNFTLKRPWWLRKQPPDAWAQAQSVCAEKRRSGPASNSGDIYSQKLFSLLLRGMAIIPARGDCSRFQVSRGGRGCACAGSPRHRAARPAHGP